ncbi:MAG: transporter substrate-binding domain-containing protein [Pseudomonadota bacterium]
MNPVCRSILYAIVVLAALGSAPAGAQTCGDGYAVKAGDTLSHIAKRAYGLSSKWSVIYYANRKAIGKSPTFIFPGQRLRIPCSDKSAKALARKVAASAEKTAPVALPASKKIRLLTADDYRPFTDRALPAGGMITDIVSTAMTSRQKDDGGPEFDVSWVNDWSAHLNPLLVNRAFDMGFPWFQPKCDRYDELDEPARFRCDKLAFSEPVFEILVLFFTKRGSGFQYTSDDDVVGSRLCRPSGYFTFDLDDDGRNWVKEEKVTLLRPQSVDECFQLLDRGEVDAVVLNEFTGRAAVTKAGLKDRVTVVERPVSLLSLHVVIAKSHPKADAYLEHVNQALRQLRQSGEFASIVENHLSVFWKTQGSS